MATLAPYSAKRTAIAWPIPDVPPVTSTFLPFSPRMASLAAAGAVAVIFLLLVASVRRSVLEALRPLQHARGERGSVDRLGARRRREPARRRRCRRILAASVAGGGGAHVVRRRTALRRGRARARARGGRAGRHLADDGRTRRRH